jgi:hypothetical protein
MPLLWQGEAPATFLAPSPGAARLTGSPLSVALQRRAGTGKEPPAQLLKRWEGGGPASETKALPWLPQKKATAGRGKGAAASRPPSQDKDNRLVATEMAVLAKFHHFPWGLARAA